MQYELGPISVCERSNPGKIFKVPVVPLTEMRGKSSMALTLAIRISKESKK